MKKEFSKKWKASKQPRKQRKYRINAHLNIKHKFLSANLNKELRKKYSRRNIKLRKGDKVKVMRGESKGKTGKINLVDIKRTRVAIEGIQRAKKDGTKINIWFNPSNLQIQELNLEDKKRNQSIEIKKPVKEEKIKFKKLPKTKSPETSEKTEEKK